MNSRGGAIQQGQSSLGLKVFLLLAGLLLGGFYMAGEGTDVASDDNHCKHRYEFSHINPKFNEGNLTTFTKHFICKLCGDEKKVESNVEEYAKYLGSKNR